MQPIALAAAQTDDPGTRTEAPTAEVVRLKGGKHLRAFPGARFGMGPPG